MKYKNASEVLPEGLLKEVQNYASGELLYIPKAEGGRSAWGAGSGARAYYAARNEEIRYRHWNEQLTAAELAKTYGLSEESIRRILYQ